MFGLTFGIIAQRVKEPFTTSGHKLQLKYPPLDDAGREPEISYTRWSNMDLTLRKVHINLHVRLNYLRTN